MSLGIAGPKLTQRIGELWSGLNQRGRFLFIRARQDENPSRQRAAHVSHETRSYPSGSIQWAPGVAWRIPRLLEAVGMEGTFLFFLRFV